MSGFFPYLTILSLFGIGSIVSEDSAPAFHLTGAASFMANDADLLGISSFSSLNAEAHLSYISAKRYALAHAAHKAQAHAQGACKNARLAAFHSCAHKFCDCQGQSSCDVLGFSVFLETQHSHLATPGGCDQAKVHRECKEKTTQAFVQCQGIYDVASKTHTTEELLSVRSANTFFNMASELVQVGNDMSSDAQSIMDEVAEKSKEEGLKAQQEAATEESSDAAQNKEATNAQAAADAADSGSEKTDEAEEEGEDMANKFRTMDDLYNANENDMKASEYTTPVPEPVLGKMQSAKAKCDSLKTLTYKTCNDEMCAYHTICGTKQELADCKEQQADLLKEEAHHKYEVKQEAIKQAAAEADAKEKEVKAPEKKEKFDNEAHVKEAKWKKEAPFREKANKEYEANSSNAKEHMEKKTAKATEDSSTAYTKAEEDQYEEQAHENAAATASYNQQHSQGSNPTTKEWAGEQWAESAIEFFTSGRRLLHEGDAGTEVTQTTSPFDAKASGYDGTTINSDENDLPQFDDDVHGFNATADREMREAEAAALEKNRADAAALKATPQCVERAQNSFNNCQALTLGEYSECTAQLTDAREAYKNWRASLNPPPPPPPAPVEAPSPPAPPAPPPTPAEHTAAVSHNDAVQSANALSTAQTAIASGNNALATTASENAEEHAVEAIHHDAANTASEAQASSGTSLVEITDVPPLYEQERQAFQTDLQVPELYDLETAQYDADLAAKPVKKQSLYDQEVALFDDEIS